MAAIPLLLLHLSSSSVSGLPVEGMIAPGSVPCIRVASLDITSLVPKDVMSGRSPLPDATCCLHRLHSVTCLHYRRRLESIIIHSTASSTSVSCQAQSHAGSLHCITLALILSRHVHNPTLVDQRCEHIIYCPRPKPLGVEGSVLEAMSAMPGCLRSDDGRGTGKRVCLCTLTRQP